MWRLFGGSVYVIDADSEGYPWCATELNNDGSYYSWGYCGITCKGTVHNILSHIISLNVRQKEKK